MPLGRRERGQENSTSFCINSTLKSGIGRWNVGGEEGGEEEEGKKVARDVKLSVKTFSSEALVKYASSALRLYLHA